MDKKLAVLILTMMSVIAATFMTQKPEKTMRDTFEDWILQNRLTVQFPDEEKEYRYRIFAQNVAAINEHNGLLGKSYKKGINKFTAYTQAQFEALYLSKMESTVKIAPEGISTPKSVGISVDWVAAGAVSPVKDQGSCISTYAFSAVGAIEGISVIFSKIKVEYSVQQIIDCSSNYGNHGCSTGTMYSSFNYVTAKGINTWASYPYAGHVQTCHSQSGNYRIAGYGNTSSCDSLDNALMARPISVAADGQYFNSYHSGVFDNCGTNLNIALLLVGATDSYYTLKNSWGMGWGESGYIRLTKRYNVCGICQAASYPMPGW